MSMQKIVVEKNVSDTNKIKKLRTILEKSGLLEKMERLKINARDLVIIKPNIAPASQKNYHYYTDPSLVNEMMMILLEKGYRNTRIVESATNFASAYDCLTPDIQASNIGYKYPVTNLSTTTTRTLTWNGMSIDLSTVMLDARFIINFPKAKNHDLMLMTCCLKNMYGSIPNPNTYRLFHKKTSGYGIPEAAFLASYFTPPSFNIVDFIEGVDGNEVSLYRGEVKNLKYYPSGRIIAGENSVAIDKLVSLKMGYTQDASPVVEYSAIASGNFDVTRSTNLIGDDFSMMPGWRRISSLFRAKAEFQDKLPVTDKIIAQGLRMYRFDVCPIDKKEES